MKEITLYRAQVHGEVRVEATSEEDAKTKALTYFASSPQQYLGVLESNKVLIEGEEE